MIMYSALIHGQIIVHSISKETFESFVKECFSLEFGTYTVAVFNRKNNNMTALYPGSISHVTVALTTSEYLYSTHHVPAQWVRTSSFASKLGFN